MGRPRCRPAGRRWSGRLRWRAGGGAAGEDFHAEDRRAEVIDWLGGLLPEFDLRLDSSDEELREYLIDGAALCYTADKLMPGVLEGVWGGYASDHRSNVKKFLSVVVEMGLPGFSVKDLEEGSMSSIVECLLALRDNVTTDQVKIFRIMLLRLQHGLWFQFLHQERDLPERTEEGAFGTPSPRKEVLFFQVYADGAAAAHEGSGTPTGRPGCHCFSPMRDAEIDAASTFLLFCGVSVAVDFVPTCSLAVYSCLIYRLPGSFSFSSLSHTGFAHELLPPVARAWTYHTGAAAPLTQDWTLCSVSVRQEIRNCEERWLEELAGLGKYHAALAENRKLFNEIQ